MKKILTMTLVVGLGWFGNHLKAQTTVGEGFEAVTFPPAGWQTLGGGGGSPTWSRRTTANAGTTPAATPFGGSGMARFSSNNAAAGGTQSLVSPVIDLSKRGTANSYISFYLYRDTIYKGSDSITLWFNTARSLTGAKRLGGVVRYAKKTYPDSVSAGWHKYSFSIPSAYTTNTNYFIIQATARGTTTGGNMFVDSVTWDAYPTFCSGKPKAGTLTASLYYICGAFGQSTLTVSGNTTTTGTSLTWQLSTDSSTWTTNATITTNPTTQFFAANQGKYRYIRVITKCANSGLSDTTKAIRIWIDNTATAPTITVTPNTATVCSGASVGAKLVATGALTYSWSPTTGLSSSTGDTTYALPTVSTFYTVTGIDAKGCPGTRNFAVQVTAGPTVTISAKDTMACEGDSVQFTATVAPVGGPPPTYTYLWSNGVITAAAYVKAIGATSVYQVSVKSSVGCETKVSKTLLGVLKPKAAYKITITGRKVSFEFTGTNATSVHWYYSDGNESSILKPTYTFGADGTYNVILVATNPPCKTDTAIIKVTVTTAASSVKNQVLAGLKMMPNPASDQAVITFNGIENAMQVLILDATGRMVYQSQPSKVNGAQGLVIPTANLATGIYQVRIKSKDGLSSIGLQVAH